MTFHYSVLKQVSLFSCKIPVIELVEIFCDVQLDQYDRAIGESLTKLTFEAVEEIIKVSSRLFHLSIFVT